MKKENSKKIKESILSTINEGILDVPGQMASGLANFGRGAVGAYRMGRLNKQLDQAADTIEKKWGSAEQTAAQLAKKMADSKNPQVKQDGANAVQNVKSAANDIKKATDKLRQISKTGAGKSQGSEFGNSGDNFEFREYEDESGMIHREGPFDRWLKKFGFDHLDNKPQKGKMQRLFLQLQGSGIDPFKVSPSEGMRILNYDGFRNGAISAQGQDPFKNGEHFVAILGSKRARDMGVISDELADFFETPEGKDYIKRVMKQSSATYNQSNEMDQFPEEDEEKKIRKGNKDIDFANQARSAQARGDAMRKSATGKAPAMAKQSQGGEGQEDIYSQMGQNIQANMRRVPMARRERVARQMPQATQQAAPQISSGAPQAQTASKQSQGLKTPLQKLKLDPQDQQAQASESNLLAKLKNLKQKGIDIKSWVAKNKDALLKKYTSQKDVAAINSLSGQQSPIPQAPQIAPPQDDEENDPSSEENIYSAMGQAKDANFMKSRFEPKQAMKGFVQKDEDEDETPDFGGMNLKSMYGTEDEERGERQFTPEDASKFEDLAKDIPATWEMSPEDIQKQKIAKKMKMPPMATMTKSMPSVSDTMNLAPPVEDKGEEIQVGSAEKPGFKPAPTPEPKTRKKKEKKG
jgi:hypothetical protein